VRLRAGLLAFLLVAAGCEWGPSGPGTILARASGPEVGGAVLEVVGSGIQGFAGRGSTRVYWAAMPGRADAFRVVLVDPDGGDMGFDMAVDDRGMDGPAVTVIAAADTGNRLIPTTSVVVRFER
jgi:hypothetical protein